MVMLLYCLPAAGKKKFRTTGNGDAELSGRMVPVFPDWQVF